LSDGRFLAVECKREGADLTKAQSVFIDRVNVAGGLAFVARDIQTVIDKLELRDRFLGLK